MNLLTAIKRDFNSEMRSAKRSRKGKGPKKAPVVTITGAMPTANRGFRPGYGTRGGAKELKVIDTSEAVYQCDTTGSITLISGVATGTDYQARVGRVVDLKSIQVRGFVYPAVNTGTIDNLARVMIVHDRNPNGAALPTIATILDAVLATAFNNLTNRDRYRVLMDKFIFVGRRQNTATQAFSSNCGTFINKYKKVNIRSVFGGTTAAIGSIQEGAIYLVTVGEAAAGVGSAFQATCRVRFTDP